MNREKMTIGKKIGMGFGIVLLFLAAVGILSLNGVGNIVENAGQVIEGNKLDGNLAQKEVDHLNWAGKVNALLTDDSITKLDVETDDHKCGFGKWLYGQGRRQAEKLVPSLSPMFKAVEEPHMKLHESAKKIGRHFKQADRNLTGFLAEKEVDHLKWVSSVKELFINNPPELKVQTDDHKCSLGKWLHGEGSRKIIETNPDFAPLVEAIKEPHHKLHQSAVEIQKVYKQTHKGLTNMLKDRFDDHRKWAAMVSERIIQEKKSLNVQTDPSLCAFGKFLMSNEAAEWKKNFPELRETLEAVAVPHNSLHASAIEINKALKKGQIKQAKHIYISKTMPALDAVDKQFQTALHAETLLANSQQEAKHVYETKTLPALDNTSKALHKLLYNAKKGLEGIKKANDIYSSETMPALAKTQNLLNEIRAETKRNVMTDEAMLSAAQSTKTSVKVIGIAAVISGLLLAFLIARGIIRKLSDISGQMREVADQVASASSQVSSASQTLAEGASEQAASIEETSSSLEEMASMTKQNAGNASQADNLMKEANKVVSSANRSMTDLTTSMEQISIASDQTQKVVKTIDEIAFQTNLLALNAAVEAARAGEAGAGFAVVAEEVRNLALRSADAAKSTAELIEGTVKKVGEGSGLVKKTNDEFVTVAESTAKVGELVAEITAASNEQSQGIGQVNTAVAEMDKVTQQNAAGAEESASASEEMNAQAEQMKSMVGELMMIVTGSSNIDSADRMRNAAGNSSSALSRLGNSLPVKNTGGSETAVHKASKISAEQLIPMDDDDFADF